jgi:phenylalanyl-tRNA synthetase beta subunit
MLLAIGCVNCSGGKHTHACKCAVVWNGVVGFGGWVHPELAVTVDVEENFDRVLIRESMRKLLVA